MTRLVEKDIYETGTQIRQYDEIFRRQTGHSMKEIAKIAVNLVNPVKKRKTAVIPVTCGLGVIKGFSDTVCAILKYCKADAYTTRNTDVAGMQEAYESKADILFMADDHVCGAFVPEKRICADNGYATGIGYAAALEQAMEGGKGREILILGAGTVGQSAAKYLSAKGGIPVICDLQEEKAAILAEQIKNAKSVKAPALIRDYSYILDASTTGSFITEKDVSGDTIIAAPGMPRGVTYEACKIANVIHNPLELGIITMYFQCLKAWEEI